MNDNKQLLAHINEEYLKQVRLRGGKETFDALLINAVFLHLPINEDGSVRFVLKWEREKVVEVYHRGPLSIVVGFDPKGK